MEVKNKVYPSKDQMRGFFETATDNEPIYMVNLFHRRTTISDLVFSVIIICLRI